VNWVECLHGLYELCLSCAFFLPVFAHAAPAVLLLLLFLPAVAGLLTGGGVCVARVVTSVFVFLN
jgi:hypothetical protein